METRTLRYLGWLGKPWGHRGELALNIGPAGMDGVLGMEVLFVELDGLGVPFFVAGMREVPRVGTLVKFEDIDDPQGAAFMVNAKVYAPPGHARSGISEEEQWSPEDLLGMQVVDEEHGLLGEVTAIEGSDDNPVMVIRSEGSEVMVPIADEMIGGIDEATGQLVVRTPPGLVEFYRRG